MAHAAALIVQCATVSVPTVKNFIASKHFVINTSPGSKVKISSLGENFKRNFLSKVEDGVVAPEQLTVIKLQPTYETDPAISSAILRGRDADLISFLGGEAKVEITLGQFFAVVAMQPNCEGGPLETNGLIAICYVRNIYGVLLPVDVGALSGGWAFGSGYSDNPEFYHEGGRQYLCR